MNLFFRLLYLVIIGIRRPRMPLTDTSKLTLRVWPTDLDLWGHVNNGIFHSVADLGRFDFMRRTGFLKYLRTKRMVPVQAACIANFRRSLTVFQRFELSTRLIGWDERWIYIESRFERDGELVAHLIARTVARGRGGAASPSTIANELGVSAPVAPDLISVAAAFDTLYTAGANAAGRPEAR